MADLTLRRAFASFHIPVRRYLLLVAAPVLVGTIAGALGLLLLLPGVFSGYFTLVPWAIPLLGLAGVVLYPLQVAQQNRHHIDHNMHYFITHLGVLATSDVPGVELFRLLGDKEDEYGPLAEECRKIATLVERWNMSLAAACRFIAHRTPSLIFSDFLERFAFATESGAEMGAYLKAEQEVVMADYDSLYRTSLQNIESLSGLFNGLMMTVIFLVIFALLIPVLVGGSATLILVGVLLGAAFLELGFVILARARAPPDPVWADLGKRSPLWKRVRWSLPLALVAAAALLPALLVLTDLPHAIVIAAAGTPLAVPGILAGRAEHDVKRRDDNFPAFVRSLGASSAARGGDAREVLRHLRHHDFGPLTGNVRDLFNRLQLRIDDTAAWRYFTTESGSRLVERFTRMYEEAIDTGGRPDAVGRLISDNMVRILGLRKLRYQKAGGFRGMLVGLAAAMAFSLFIGVGVLDMLVGLFSNVTGLEDAPIEVPSIVHTDAVNIPELSLIVLLLLVVNAAFSSVLVRFVDGGTKVRSFHDFSLLLWVSMVAALVSRTMLSGLTVTSLGA